MTPLPITTSLFDLFKVGPGPSSSHTIGPMKAAYDFIHNEQVQSFDHANRVMVHLYGSLAATGRGHGTDRAVLAGLLGWQPDTCDIEQFAQLGSDTTQVYSIRLGRHIILITINAIVFHREPYASPFSNTLVCQLYQDQSLLCQEEYYSIGGGFIQRKGATVVTESIRLPYPYNCMEQLKKHLEQHSITLDELLLANEVALTGATIPEIEKRITTVFEAMHRAVAAGICTEGVLPGTIHLQRKASALYRRAQSLSSQPEAFLVYLNAYSLAASEENAAGHRVVTAPTSGASGVIPGLSYLLKHHYHHSPQTLQSGFLAAAMVGFLVKHNASISGAEMGCMGEVGTAAAMGAAMLAHSQGYSIEVVEAAAEIALEHHLGMTCDPIGGYVQIPCIERNAMGAAKAYNAYLLAASGNHAYQKISLDRVIQVMRATGRDMSKKYKETSEGGLALSSTEC